MAEVLKRDIFPGELLLPDGTVVLRARVFVTTHRILAYQAEGREIRKALEVECDTQAIAPHHGTMGNGHLEAFTDTGRILINRGRGCSCGALASMAAPVGWRG